MKLARYLKPPQVCLDLDFRLKERLGEAGVDGVGDPWAVKVAVLDVLTHLLATTGRVGSQKKLLADLVNREKKASTALGGGLAVPHVRSKQAKEFMLCFARSEDGVDFEAPDGQPVHLFFCVCAPPYDDRFYLDVYRSLGAVFGHPEIKQAFLDARDEHEVIRALSRYQDDPVDSFGAGG